MPGFTPYGSQQFGYPMPWQQQQMMPQPGQQMMPQPPQSPQQTSLLNLARVQGEAAAKAYPVPPGCTGAMMDIEKPYLYIKTVGMDNVPYPLRKFRVIEEFDNPQPEQAQPVGNSDQFVNRKEFDALANLVNELKEALPHGEPAT